MTGNGELFAGFADQWTPVRFGHEVPDRQPVGLRLAGEKVVVFRDQDGLATALLDRCPHKGVELSLGRVTRKGCIECPFHGWRFDSSGSCVRIPWDDVADKKHPERFTATALPTSEVGGMVWVYTGLDRPEREPAVPDGLLADVAFFRHAEEWSTHWTRAMENMLDSPHLPFVHRRSIGLPMRSAVRKGERMDVHVEPREHGMRITWDIGGAPGDGSLEWWRPNGMALDIGGQDRLFRQHMWCVPVDDGTVRMMLTTARGFGGKNVIASTFDRFNRVILGEDRAIVESSDPPEVPLPGVEASVPTDRATLAFRRWYYEELRAPAT